MRIKFCKKVLAESATNANLSMLNMRNRNQAYKLRRAKRRITRIFRIIDEWMIQPKELRSHYNFESEVYPRLENKRINYSNFLRSNIGNLNWLKL